MRISAFRKAHFNAAHRLYISNLTDEENARIFGSCSNPLYHGHNYDLEVKVTGEVDPRTGFLIDLKVLKEYIKEHVENVFDHKNINLEVEEFMDEKLNPTAENICYVIWQRLRVVLDEKFELTVRLYETPRNYVEYPAS